ncbi:M12 family metallopeptidase [Aquimarina sp. MMG016]|uniref:M12 family metallopeptidase n=1 Tax=Aquimarina sp. MMG016 TaxID=2822690 RepID=UPI001B3A77A3|nr:M12 family metallopeptidase [Aquimarina sp. MMG016]MBQ4818476.1 M12 family metallopeptidase [Aquimarina sp. MMG016]
MKTNIFRSKFWISIFLISNIILFTNCERDLDVVENEIVSQENIQEKEFTTELAFPNRSGDIVDINLEGQNVKAEKIDEFYVVEGDMLFTDKSLQDTGKSTGRKSKYWPNCTVYYTIESNLPNKQRVYDAINHWRQHSNFQFVYRTNQPNYINFKVGSGCSSWVGMQGGKQNINLAAGCSTGSTIHEIGHAIGLWHEQSRKDRDNYVTIKWGNIQAGKTHNFQTYIQRGEDGDEYSPNLDFSSIMMYGPKAFSKNGLPTITKKNGSSYSVQRSGLSFWDKHGIKKMYKNICGTIENMSGYYKANDGGHYYVRQIGTNVYWFGEHPSGTWANVFKGKLDGNIVNGQFYDVPKGKIKGYGSLKLSVNSTGTKITKISGSNFGGSSWTKTTKPAYLPPTRPQGFGTRNNINDLTARWYANDGGFYYMRQLGNTVVWFGERHFTSGRPSWSNVAVGTRYGNTVWLSWVDVPKGYAGNSGVLGLKIDNANKLTRTYTSGSFGGSSWTR